MNAPTTNPLQTFFWLLKREYWEHRGAFLRTPMIVGGVMIAITILSLIVAETTALRSGIDLNGIRFDSISQNMTPDQIAQFNSGLKIGLLSLSIPIGIAQSIVIFTYLLGALYNDRRDRSVLFWKSLPVSDLNTVLSKVATAVFIVPLFAIAAIIALHLVFLIVIGVWSSLHGVNPLPLLWNPVPLLSMWINMILLIPIYALWALPTVGWLLLCSAFARSKPSRWAVLGPLCLGVIIGFSHLLQQISVPSAWYWKNIVYRILLGIVPGGWLDIGNYINNPFYKPDFNSVADKSDFLHSLLGWDRIFAALTLPDIWIGVAAGIVLIAAAIWFRRQRTEAYS